jgi:hypothetical protein
MPEAVPVLTFLMTPRATRTPLCLHTFYKGQPEVWTLALDCTPALPPGILPADVVVTALDCTDGSDATEVVLTNAITPIAGALAQIVVKEGTPGHAYSLDMQVTLDDDLATVMTETVMMSILPEGT